MEKKYVLRSELRGHEEDVRGLCVCPSGIITTSRDKTIKHWVQAGSDVKLEHTLVGHTNYVGPAVWMAAPAGIDAPLGLLITGSRDTSIIVWDLSTARSLRQLSGHQYQVAALALLPTGVLVSASLDRTIKMWDLESGACLRTIEEHAGAVLSLAVLPTGNFLSGSGDTTIKVWSSEGQLLHTFTGHTDTVRALCILPDVGFISGSHDTTVRIWSTSGECLTELIGHTALVYSVAVTEGGILASGSEDNTCRVWRADGECLQVIDHPGCVWDVAFTSDKQLITACSDSAARVWTTNQDAVASPEVVTAYEAAVATFKKPAAAQGGSGSAPAGLPPGLKTKPPSVLQNPGGKDGETICVLESNGGVNAYAWDAGAFKWEKIGEVVAGPGNASTGKKLHNGQEWDFVFDVDIEDGVPPRKLPCNIGENPYIVAQRFIDDEGIPAYFKEQIVQFVVQNTGGAAPQPVYDMPITGGGWDPLTGTGGPPAPQSVIAPTPSESNLTYTPATAFLVFDTPPATDALLRKLREFNALIGGQPTTAPMALGEVDLADGGAVPALLTKASSRSTLTTHDLAALHRLLSWPPAQLFPALDIARLVVLEQTNASALMQSAGSFAEPPAGSMSAILSQALSPSSPPATLQTALRFATNCFAHPTSRSWVVGNMSVLCDKWGDSAAGNSAALPKGARLSAATLLLNMAIALRVDAAANADTKMQVLSALIELASSCPANDVDSMQRSLLGIGTLMYHDKETTALAGDLGVRDVLEAVKSNTDAPNELLAVALDVMTLLLLK